MGWRALGAVVLTAGLITVWWNGAAEGDRDLGAGPAGTRAAERPNINRPPELRQVPSQRHRTPGEWSVVNGKLEPGRALRDRFDSYWPLGPGVSLVEVRSVLARDAQEAVGPALVPQVLKVWDGYARLMTYPWQQPLKSQEPQTWMATLQEQARVRRQLLGAEWAQAFFNEDEERLLGRLAQMKARRLAVGAAASAPMVAASQALPVEKLMAERPPGAGGAEAGGAERLAEARLGPAGEGREINAEGGAVAAVPVNARDEARREWARLQTDASLDVAQRVWKMRLYLEARFDRQEQALLARELPLP